MPFSSPQVRPYTSAEPHRGLRLRWAMALFAWLISAAAQGAWQSPLTSTEKSNAELIALSKSSSGSTISPRSDIQSPHPLGIQVLLTEPLEQKHSNLSNARLVEVFLFNHHTHSAELRLVDLQTQTVLSAKKLPSIHLPLSTDEIRYSVDAVRSHSDVKARLVQEQSAHTQSADGELMSSLQLRVSIWVPQSTDSETNKRCHLERCALVSVFDAESNSYITEPVVHLKTGEVSLDWAQ